MSIVTGMNVATIRRGRRELDDSLAGRPENRIRMKKRPATKTNGVRH